MANLLRESSARVYALAARVHRAANARHRTRRVAPQRAVRPSPARVPRAVVRRGGRFPPPRGRALRKRQRVLLVRAPVVLLVHARLAIYPLVARLVVDGFVRRARSQACVREAEEPRVLHTVEQRALGRRADTLQRALVYAQRGCSERPRRGRSFV